jgi:hypothetical protein
MDDQRSYEYEEMQARLRGHHGVLVLENAYGA